MVDPNATAHQNTIDLELDTATTLNISGDAGLIITATGGTLTIIPLLLWTHLELFSTR